MIEEATNGNPWAPTTVTLRSISKAAFELDDYRRIIEILHKRYFYISKVLNCGRSCIAILILRKIAIKLCGFNKEHQKAFCHGLDCERRTSLLIDESLWIKI